jgi:hypothetical protein
MRTKPVFGNPSQPWKYLLPLLFLVACGGGDDGNSSYVADGGIGGTGMSSGPISAFGSIFVNGIEFETDDTMIVVNGQEATESDLKIGMVVQVKGTIVPDKQTGNASRIDFNENVKGPIQRVDDDGERLIVLGQTVIVEQQAVLDGIVDVTDLKVGDVVSVSGLVDADGIIHATLIVRESSIAEFEVVGRVANLDLAAQTFMIGDLTIDYSQVLRLDVFGGVLSNGLLVDVRGAFAGVLTGEVLMASSVVTEDELSGAEVGTIVEIEGFVTRFDDRFDFEVAQLSVTTTSQTVFQFGGADDLGLGVKVQVEGTLDANGVLVLEEVSFKSAASELTPAGRIDIEADVEAVDVASQEVTLLGLSIQTSYSTQFVDRRDADAMVPFGLEDLRIGDRVEMTGFFDLATHTLIAEVLVREAFRVDGQVVLEGPIDRVDANAGTLTILGITVQTDSETVYEDEIFEVVMSAEQFFASVQQSDLLVEAEGVFVGGVLYAESLEFGD